MKWLSAAVYVLLLVTLKPNGANGQTPSDETQISAQMHRLVDLFNARDAAAIGELYDVGADRREASGAWAHGRAEIVAMYDKTFRALPGGASVRWEFHVRFLQASSAVVDGDWIRSDGVTGPFTIVVLKNADRWLVAAGRQGGPFLR